MGWKIPKAITNVTDYIVDKGPYAKASKARKDGFDAGDIGRPLQRAYQDDPLSILKGPVGFGQSALQAQDRTRMEGEQASQAAYNNLFQAFGGTPRQTAPTQPSSLLALLGQIAPLMKVFGK
jgi:hypothetical protein